MKISNPNHPLWAICSRLITVLPVLLVLFVITSKWDGELVALLAVLGGREASSFFDRWVKTPDSQSS